VLQAVIFVLSGCFVVFVCSPIHELAHGYTAHLLGDDTAKNQGRLTFNPIAHIDLIGMLMILFFGFGYAKPVPVNPRNFKNQKGGMALTSLAGPVSNLIMAFISVFLFYFLSAVINSSNVVVTIVLTFLYYAAYINVSLGVFNLIPIPPLDGSKIIASVLPNKIYYKYMMYERYVMIALIILLFTGVLDNAISFLSYHMMQFISIIPRFLFT
jgi:Zn-dependent protease